MPIGRGQHACGLHGDGVVVAGGWTLGEDGIYYDISYDVFWWVVARSMSRHVWVADSFYNCLSMQEFEGPKLTQSVKWTLDRLFLCSLYWQFPVKIVLQYWSEDSAVRGTADTAALQHSPPAAGMTPRRTPGCSWTAWSTGGHPSPYRASAGTSLPSLAGTWVYSGLNNQAFYVQCQLWYISPNDPIIRYVDHASLRVEH